MLPEPNPNTILVRCTSAVVAPSAGIAGALIAPRARHHASARLTAKRHDAHRPGWTTTDPKLSSGEVTNLAWPIRAYAWHSDDGTWTIPDPPADVCHTLPSRATPAIPRRYAHSSKGVKRGYWSQKLATPSSIFDGRNDVLDARKCLHIGEGHCRYRLNELTTGGLQRGRRARKVLARSSPRLNYPDGNGPPTGPTVNRKVPGRLQPCQAASRRRSQRSVASAKPRQAARSGLRDPLQ